MAIMAVLSLLSLSPLALMLPFAQRSVQPVTQRAEPTRMMFGGGKGDGGEGGFMDKLKQAQEMFNPEMMKKYTQVGVRVQQLQQELAQTEVECSTKDGGVSVKISGTQVPISIEVSDALCAKGVETVSAELTLAMKQAHARSGKYAQDKMKDVYVELGLAPGMAGQ